MIGDGIPSWIQSMIVNYDSSILGFGMYNKLSEVDLSDL